MHSIFSKVLLSTNTRSSLTGVISKWRLQCYSKQACARKLKMNEAYVLSEKESDLFTVSFRYTNTDLNVDREFNFNRKMTEPVDAFLYRINVNISKTLKAKLAKKQKKAQKKNVEYSITNLEDVINMDDVGLYKNGEKIDGNVPLNVVLTGSSDVKLVVYEQTYILIENAPTITSIALPTTILVGFPVYPTKFKCINTDIVKSEFYWHKQDTTLPSLSQNQWTPVGEGYFYTPSNNDIGHKLKVSCAPKNETHMGPVAEIESKVNVEAGPGPCPFETRQAFTRNKLNGKSFRITSYNILANTYAETDFSKTVLFPYCPSYALDITYRKQLILKELIGYNSDIICLQEVDSSVYRDDLMPCLNILNYGGVFNTKAESNEGLAMFFNKNRFTILDSKHTIFGKNTDFTRFQNTWAKIENEKVKESFTERNTTVQVATLQSKENPSQILIVSNTHLYFRPNADHIRLLQAYYLLNYVQDIAEETKLKNPDMNISLLLCGDYNSTPECGVYQLMTENYVPENSKDWCSNPEQVITNISLSHDLHLSSACGTPEYTNYTPEFAGCLDYIFYQKESLTVEQIIPMPAPEELALCSGLPSVVFPSDHISLCADLKWTI